MIERDAFEALTQTPSKLIGHRGMGTTHQNTRFAENSIESLIAALKTGADGVEFDVHLSSDGVPVLHHDPTLGDVADLSGQWAPYVGTPIGDLPVDTLTQIPLKQGQDQTIPTLKAALDAIESLSRGKEIWIELKTPYGKTDEQKQRLAQGVKDIVDVHPIASTASMWFLSFDRPLLHFMQDAYGDAQINTVYILGADDALKAKEHIGYAVASGFTGVGLHPFLAPWFKDAEQSNLRVVSGGLGVDINAFTKALLKNPSRVAFTTDELAEALRFRAHIQGRVQREGLTDKNNDTVDDAYLFKGYVTEQVFDLFAVDEVSLDVQLDLHGDNKDEVLSALQTALGDDSNITVYEHIDAHLRVNIQTHSRAHGWQHIHALYTQGLITQASSILKRNERWFVPHLRRFRMEPDTRYHWALEQIRALDAWDVFWDKWPRKQLADDIVIGHIDSGFTSHPCFDGSGTARIDVANGRDYLQHLAGADIQSDPKSTHGLRTGSVIAGNQTSKLGVAPTSTLLPCRVVKKTVGHEAILWGKYFGGKEMERVASAIEHCIDAQVDIISISLGGAEVNPRVEAALKKAHSADIIVIAAAGNFLPGVTYPANSTYTICCGATGPEQTPWIGSGRGPWIDVCAPGDGVPVATIDDVTNHTTSYGTSYSTAYTAGACALWLSYWGDVLEMYRDHVSLTEVFRHVLQHTSRKIKHAWLLLADVGLLDVNALLEYDLPSVDTFTHQPVDAPTPPPSHEAVAIGMEAYLNTRLEAHGSTYALDHHHAWPLCDALLGSRDYMGYYHELLDAIVSSDVMRPTYINLYGHNSMDLSTLTWIMRTEASQAFSDHLTQHLTF